MHKAACHFRCLLRPVINVIYPDSGQMTHCPPTAFLFPRTGHCCDPSRVEAMKASKRIDSGQSPPGLSALQFSKHPNPSIPQPSRGSYHSQASGWHSAMAADLIATKSTGGPLALSRCTGASSQPQGPGRSALALCSQC